MPTVIPVVSQWPQRTPWLMTSPAQFRPGPPPPLTSEVWARDYNEIKALGSKNSTRRTAEQTAIARFWEATMPPIYHGVVRSVATVPEREVTQNARLFAAVTQAMDDALIAVMDAKYHYNLWRPITAIRNGDIDGNDATEREPSWTPFIDTPMHPEYPCAHCIVSGAVGTVLHAEVGTQPHADFDNDQCHCPRRGAELGDDRRLHAGGGQCAHLRRRALPHLHGSRHGHGQTDWRTGRSKVPAVAQVERTSGEHWVLRKNLRCISFPGFAGRVQAEQRPGADCLQRPLRSRFRQQLRPGVRRRKNASRLAPS